MPELSYFLVNCLALKESCAKLLGVWLQADMGMRNHVHFILHIFNQGTYLLTQLKMQWLLQTQLQSIFDSIILARVLYASPAWRGYLNATDIDSLQQLFVKAKRWHIVSDNYDVSQLFENCDMVLLKSSLITVCDIFIQISGITYTV